MKKVLLIAFFFPPYLTVGSQRPYRLAKYFPKFGWQPIVLTAKLPEERPEGIRIIETEYKDVISIIKSRFGFNPQRGLHEQLGIPVSKNFNYPTLKSKLIKLTKEVINFPDDRRGWYKYALKSASEFLLENKVDAIISTSSPVTSHLIARKLKQKYKVPWVADLRDLWTQNHFLNKFGLIEYFEKRLELKTLADADALVTVTNGFADKLKIIHKDKKVFCITNGYDPDNFPKTQVNLTNKFTITYTGLLYGGKRDPSLLFEVVAQLIKERKIDKDLIEIRFYGHKEDWLIEEIDKFNLRGVAIFGGFVSREKALEKQKESQLLLLLLDKGDREKEVYPAKVFEYFGARRPIVATGGSRECAIKKLLEETKTGKFAEKDDTLKNLLLEYYQEFVNYGEVKCHSNGNIEKYTYKSIAKRYSDVLNEICRY